MAQILVMPGTSSVLAQYLNGKSRLPELAKSFGTLEAHAGVDWAQWGKVRTTMLVGGNGPHTGDNGLGGALDILI